MADLAVPIVNQALEQIGVQVQVTSVFPSDGTAAGDAANVLYNPAVEMVLREGDWDFARRSAPLELLKEAMVPPVETWDETQPPPPWRFAYRYPAEALYVRYLRPNPLGFQGGDGFEPLPITYTIANDLVGDIETKVILTDLEAAMAVFTVRAGEAAWDSIFREAVVRTLASSFAMALAGRPDFSQGKLNESFQVIGVGAARVG